MRNVSEGCPNITKTKRVSTGCRARVAWVLRESGRNGETGDKDLGMERLFGGTNDKDLGTEKLFGESGDKDLRIEK